jgi:hypothetical protein
MTTKTLFIATAPAISVGTSSFAESPYPSPIFNHLVRAGKPSLAFFRLTKQAVPEETISPAYEVNQEWTRSIFGYPHNLKTWGETNAGGEALAADWRNL